MLGYSNLNFTSALLSPRGAVCYPVCITFRGSKTQAAFAQITSCLTSVPDIYTPIEESSYVH